MAGEKGRENSVQYSVFSGPMVTLPPKHKIIQSERSASRPGLAAATHDKGRSNLFGPPFAFGRAASRGRLALRLQCPNAPVFSAPRFRLPGPNIEYSTARSNPA